MTAHKQIVEVPGLFDSRPFGYEQCVRVGDHVFVAGQGGDLDEQMQLISSDFATQARQALTNVGLALAAAGAIPADVTAVIVYLTDIANLRTFGAIKAEMMPELRATGTAVEVNRLALPNMQIEITVTAVRAS